MEEFPSVVFVELDHRRGSVPLRERNRVRRADLSAGEQVDALQEARHSLLELSQQNYAYDAAAAAAVQR